MTTFLDQVTLATDEAFVRRVQQAAVKVALAVSAEATSGDANYDGARLGFAQRILLDPQRQARLLAFGVASNPAVNAGSSDSDLEFTVSSIFDAYAGARQA